MESLFLKKTDNIAFRKKKKKFGVSCSRKQFSFDARLCRYRLSIAGGNIGKIHATV